VASVNPDSLPLLEFTLDELYKRKREDGMLTFAAYRELGGVEGALATRAGEVLASLPAPVQAAFSPVFREQVSLAAASDVPTRKSASFARLRSTPEKRTFVDAFIAARLLTADRSGADGPAVVRIAHEALVSRWQKLADWIEENRALLQIRARIAAASATWDDGNRTRGFLLAIGGPLEEARRLLSENFDLSDEETAFIDASEQQASCVRLAKRAAVAALVGLTILAVVGGGVAEYQREGANAARAAAETQKRRADVNAVQAEGGRREADAARKIAEEQKVVAEKAKALADQNAQSATAAKFVAERRLAESYLDRGLRLCEEEEAGRGVLWLARALEVLSSARSTVGAGRSDVNPGRRIIDGDAEHAIRANLGVWCQSISRLKTLIEQKDCVNAVAYSPDGKTILTGNKNAQLWDAATGKAIGAPFYALVATAVAYSPDGKTILIASAGLTAHLWDVTTRQEIGEPLRHRRSVIAVAFSPDGKKVLTGSVDKTACLWNAATGEPIGVPLQHQKPVRTVAYSPDGKTVLTGSGEDLGGNGEAQLWDVLTGRPIGLPLRHEGGVNAVAYSPDGKIVLTGSSDKSACLWDAVTSKPMGAPLQHQASVRAVAFSRDGKTILTGSGDLLAAGGKARLWDAATGKPIGAPLDLPNAVNGVAWSPDGKTVLTGSGTVFGKGEIGLWDAATGEPVGAPFRHQGKVTAVAFSPNGKTVVTGSSGKTAQLWDALTGRPIGAPLQHEDGSF
jgi:WD40 repeat protein